MKLSALLDTVKTLIDAIYPPRCCVCNCFLHHDDVPGTATPLTPEKFEGRTRQQLFSTAMSSVMCRHCLEDVSVVEPPLCPVCGVMFTSREGIDHSCEQCHGSRRFFQSARAVGIYQGALMTAVHRYKYHHKLILTEPLSDVLFSAFTRWFASDEVDLVLPVPLHRQKFRQRGFNQSYLLIRKWWQVAARHNIRFPQERVRSNLLVRVRKTRSQTTLSRQERLENVKNAFALTDTAAVEGKRVLVVDDVYTTGATVNECARLLDINGATRVDILTLARVS